MSRRLVRAVVAAGLLAALAAGPTPAQEAEVSGRVEGVVALSLRQVSPEAVEATATATVPGTALTMTRAGRSAQALRAYAEPIANARVTVRTETARAGVTEQTITFGPETP